LVPGPMLAGTKNPAGDMAGDACARLPSAMATDDGSRGRRDGIRLVQLL
jgi:hypothetical protein